MTLTSVVARCISTWRTGVATAMFACTALGTAQAQVTLTSAQIDSAFARDSQSVFGGRLAVGADAFFGNLGWQNWRTWLHTDDQRFNTDGSYGPVAYIAPADTLEFRTLRAFHAAGNNGTLTAVILVDTTYGASLRDAYTGLGLAGGFNCVNLQYDSTLQPTKRWKAYVYPAQGASSHCALPTPLPAELTVRRVTNPRFLAMEDVPPVARFHEGRRDGARRPFFGMKCAEGWCMVLPANADSSRLPHAGVNVDRREWAMHGWHDVQRVALVDHNRRPVPSSIRGSVVPVRGLRDINRPEFTAGYQQVATVVFHDDIRGTKYADRYHFVRGRNHVFLKRDTSSPTGWRAQVRNISGTFELPVSQHLHGRAVPGTARFRWIDTDEGLWVRCEDGCCKVIPT